RQTKGRGARTGPPLVGPRMRAVHGRAGRIARHASVRGAIVMGDDQPVVAGGLVGVLNAEGLAEVVRAGGADSGLLLVRDEVADQAARVMMIVAGDRRETEVGASLTTIAGGTDRHEAHDHHERAERASLREHSPPCESLATPPPSPSLAGYTLPGDRAGVRAVAPQTSYVRGAQAAICKRCAAVTRRTTGNKEMGREGRRRRRAAGAPSQPLATGFLHWLGKEAP